jgi:dephospho-CoA kinase|tara:strand:- start:3870 stop:4556 length:687 start_codon:yes stop_codon:yes gene_type:complete
LSLEIIASGKIFSGLSKRLDYVTFITMKNYHIGLTGSIGSGKSTVAKILMQKGIPVYFADDSAKRLMIENLALMDAITSEFGDGVYIDGVLQRAELAKRAFSTAEATARINALVHPAVHDDFTQWHNNQQAIYVIREAAILFESGTYENCDSIILVEASMENRLQRIKNRSKLNEEQIKQRMSRQMSQAKKRSMLTEKDFIIENDQSLIELNRQVDFLHESLLSRFSV